MLELERKPYYSPTEFAKIVSVDPSTVLDWIHRGTLYAVKLGPKTYRIPLAVVMRRLNPDVTRPAHRMPDRQVLEAAERRRERRPVATPK